jgi:hypothetical protein
MVMALLPLFVTVTTLAALVVLTNWLPKLMGDPGNEIALPDTVSVTVFDLTEGAIAIDGYAPVGCT